jgi:hypothetical protein
MPFPAQNPRGPSSGGYSGSHVHAHASVGAQGLSSTRPLQETDPGRIVVGADVGEAGWSHFGVARSMSL